MISRRSSGSKRADSAVEPTKSENITVTWRRSAVSLGRLRARQPLTLDAPLQPDGRSRKLSNCSHYFSAMPDGHAKSIKVLVRQLAENLNIDVVLGKALRVLGHAELFEPVRNLLHCGPSSGGLFLAGQSFWTRATEGLSSKSLDSTPPD